MASLSFIFMLYLCELVLPLCVYVQLLSGVSTLLSNITHFVVVSIELRFQHNKMVKLLSLTPVDISAGIAISLFSISWSGQIQNFNSEFQFLINCVFQNIELFCQFFNIIYFCLQRCEISGWYFSYSVVDCLLFCNYWPDAVQSGGNSPGNG